MAILSSFLAFYFFNDMLRKPSSPLQDFKTIHPCFLLEVVRFYYLHLNLCSASNLL